jgi:hypothetical protein
MKKVRFAVITAVAVFGIVAVAQAVTNTYTFSGKVSPSKAGTKKKPVAVSVSFNLGIGETATQRPATIKSVEIAIPDGKVNGKPFPKCTVAILTANGPSGCPKGSQVGGGAIESVAGDSANPADKSLACHVDAKAFNAANGHLLLHVVGSPSAPKPCAIPISQTIDATLKTSGSTTTLKFTIPDNLTHPIPGFDNVPTSVIGSVKKLTKTVKGKKVPFIAATACKGGKHVIKAKITLENGTVEQTSGNVPCKK